MIWLAFYATGVMAALVLHGIYGSWQDDGLGVFHAIMWPVFIPIALLLAPIRIARWVAKGGLASAMSARRAKTPKAVEGRGPASAGRQATPK
jgi:hypothetical protein